VENSVGKLAAFRKEVRQMSAWEREYGELPSPTFVPIGPQGSVGTFVLYATPSADCCHLTGTRSVITRAKPTSSETQPFDEEMNASMHRLAATIEFADVVEVIKAVPCT
jgi:hypothetical protein